VLQQQLQHHLLEKTTAETSCCKSCKNSYGQNNNRKGCGSAALATACTSTATTTVTFAGKKTIP